jgi:multidrug efflux pump subunit AcrA (membrane-fusion protein)
MSGLKALASHAARKRVRNAVIALVLVSISIFVYWELKIPAQFKILPKAEAIARAETSGVVTDVLAREGVRVHKDEVLARTRDYDKSNQLDRITGELNEAKSKLERLKAPPRPDEITQIEDRIAAKQTELANLTRNQQERTRLQEALAQQKARLRYLEVESAARKQEYDLDLIAKITWQEAQSAVEVKQHEILESEAAIRDLDERSDRDSDLIKKQLAGYDTEMRLLKAGNRPELIRETQAEVTKLESLMASLNQEIGKSEIRAPIDGTVVTPFPERKFNQKLGAGEEFVRIVDTEGVMVEMMVPEKDLEEVKIGNVVWLTFRSLPNDDFQGRVDFIAPVAQTVNGQQMVAVRTQLENMNNVLKPEMTGYGRIYCGKRRLIDLMTRRVRNWFKTDFLNLF